MTAPGDIGAQQLAPVAADDYALELEHTDWGPARRLRPPAVIDGMAMAWQRGASARAGMASCNAMAKAKVSRGAQMAAAEARRAVM